MGRADPACLGRSEAGPFTGGLRERGVGIDQAADIDQAEHDQQEHRQHQGELDQRLTAFLSWESLLVAMAEHQLLSTAMSDEQRTIEFAVRVWLWIFSVPARFVSVPVKPARSHTSSADTPPTSFQWVCQ